VIDLATYREVLGEEYSDDELEQLRWALRGLAREVVDRFLEDGEPASSTAAPGTALP
jgi:hypothetical protein